ncbi:DUF5999 family protein [Streptomyces sp. NPDC057694]|uniref:DUF5999 family protein n=1 Tax=Streptomyces sp. NPDC057694 TaxID=3346216 RepID=UPI0036CAA845
MTAAHRPPAAQTSGSRSCTPPAFPRSPRGQASGAGTPPCPTAEAPAREIARIAAHHPEQIWGQPCTSVPASTLCRSLTPLRACELVVRQMNMSSRAVDPVV